MPTKRRLSKGRRLNDEERQQLLEGPDACLLAGVGYLGRFPAASTAHLDAGQLEELHAEMRDDWQRYGAELLHWWRTGEPSSRVKPWTWVPHGGEQPWALREFGEP